MLHLCPKTDIYITKLLKIIKEIFNLMGKIKFKAI
jgi:hypothetical protein